MSSDFYTTMICKTYSTNNYNFSILGMRKSASDTVGTLTETDDGDILGRFIWQGINASSDAFTAAFIGSTQIGAATSDYCPGDLRFATCDGTSAIADRMFINKYGNIGIGVSPTTTMSGLAVEQGLLTLKETVTPGTDTNYGKVYTKSDNKLYFQSGDGVEHVIAYV
jgi:hypothetical protein